ncbi:hypothetical protein HMPREF0298_1571 [Corynebacterium lipophiloflavum DSM 44291]|uniref:Uncharacterized protein n=1 Tax=Corynebacterium lipophiloflavum (strain ATCC 700352 / DSM 44291 / CCUG 37336 / JCM 10383 / DMMZ 1944) TaxID=525263 RepID=C0XT01_CORLD|nr:hypothetical protein HMPREF0298_1571 [Corynebacterium lipophiloflavum DSM 44291]
MVDGEIEVEFDSRADNETIRHLINLFHNLYQLSQASRFIT